MKSLFFKLKFYTRAYRRLEIMNKAASLSYYTFISVFPLILILAAVLGRFVSDAVVLETVNRFVQETLPYQSDLVMRNVTALFAKKTAFSWFGAVTLLISAEILYVNFENIVNGLLHTEKQRHFLMTRLFFFLWLLGIVFVLFFPLLIELVANWLTNFGIQAKPFSHFFARGGFVLVGFMVFLLVMTILPTRRIHSKRLFLGALSFALTLQAGKFIFKWITLRNLYRYNLVYGSLSSMVLVTLWIFYFYNMFLFFVYWVGRERDPLYHKR